MSRFHDLKVRSVESETPEAVAITFDVPDGDADAFRYQPGQHLTIRREINGEDVRRSYSICSSVGENTLKIAVRHVEDGRFSGFANSDLSEGDTLQVFPPVGHFNVDLEPDSARNYVAVAAGSGITPILSIIKTTLETEPKSTFTLFYGNRTAASTMFRREISELKNRYLARFTFFHFLSQENLELDLFQGRIDGEKVKSIFERMIKPEWIDHFFLCGPGSMITEVGEALLAHGIDRERIHFERFTTEGEGEQKATRPAPKSQKVADGAEITVVLDGEEKMFTHPDPETTILDAASDAGADVPFACKGGVCCTCRAKLISGEVNMVLNYGLEQDELDAGYILTCQSFPVTDKVVVDYDQ